jgi:hypothetical protein
MRFSGKRGFDVFGVVKFFRNQVVKNAAADCQSQCQTDPKYTQANFSGERKLHAKRPGLEGRTTNIRCLNIELNGCM